MKADTRHVDELAPYHANPRRGDVNRIARSLGKLGQYRPLVVNEGTLTGRPLEVLAGNHTLEAAKTLGLDLVDVVLIDVDDQHAARIVAADNRTADLGGYDSQTLNDLLGSLPDLTGTGYETMPTQGKPALPARNVFRLGSLKIALDEDDTALLGDVMDAYVERYGVLAGFIGWLADGGEEAPDA